MSLANTAIGLSAEQTEQLKVLAARENKRSGEDKPPVTKLLEAAGLSAEQVATFLQYAAAEGKTGKDLDALGTEQILQMIQRREAIVRALPTFDVNQIGALNRNLSRMRHDVNGKLAIMLAGAELAKLKPEMAAKMIDRMIGRNTIEPRTESVFFAVRIEMGKRFR